MRALSILKESVLLWYRLSISKRKQPTKEKAKILRIYFENLGSLFVKFGQLLSLRPDILKKEYCDELFYLLEEVPPFPKENVDRAFQEEFGKLPTEIFDTFKYASIASASLGQVHVAYTKKGEQVAVKIQRPNIQELVNKDLSILNILGKLHDFFSKNKITLAIKELKSWTLRELDYVQEAENATALESNEDVQIPAFFPKYSSKKIITFEFIDGFTLRKYLTERERKNKRFLAAAKKSGFDEKKICDKLISYTLDSVFIKGHFHADPHPANIMFSKGNLYYIDFGVIGNLSEKQRLLHLRYTRSSIIGDFDITFKEFLIFANATDFKDKQLLRKGHDALLKNFRDSFEIKNGPALGVYYVDTLRLIAKYNLNVPEDRIRYLRAMLTIQSVIYQINPKLITDQLASKFLAVSVSNLIQNFPRKIANMNLQQQIYKVIDLLEKIE